MDIVAVQSASAFERTAIAEFFKFTWITKLFK